MDTKVGQGFSKFVVYVLQAIFIVITVGTLGRMYFYYKLKNYSISVYLIAVYIAALVCMIYALKRTIDKKIVLTSIVALGAIFRLIWCWSVKSIPVSDFQTIYTAAHDLLNGKNDIFVNLGYFARYPHLIMFTLYMAGVISIFGTYALTALKGINIIASTVSIILVYLMVKRFLRMRREVL